ncbi:hypothetical protein LI82_04140 [Methanococcoides methylutens]|uniref:C2H2-type domain-containing protein n=1 Tax=Methanococcoides methylutens TaxID=2226 RepID=A0A099T2X2_METMT|nr:hypothetical protein [Methanococcoides methylutens]KGK99219.1 hypothetical protein LI82_04140 [Methanococcoides methylutens]
MKICNKCEIKYPDTNLFCNKCHSLLQLQKVVTDSKSKKQIDVGTILSEKKKTKLDKPISKDIGISEIPIYDDWEPPAATTVYSKMKNIPYGVLKYNLSKGLYTIGIGQIRSYLDDRTYSCKSCSYYTSFDYELCSLKEAKVKSNAICKSFEVSPEFQVSLDSTNKKEKDNENVKEKKKKRKTFYCCICNKAFHTEEGRKRHLNAKH